MATDSLKKAIDTYRALQDALGDNAAEQAGALATKAPTVTIKQPPKPKGETQ